MPSKALTAWIGMAVVVMCLGGLWYLLGTTSIGLRDGREEGNPVAVKCDSVINAGPPEGRYLPWDSSERYIEDQETVNRICDTNRDRRIAWSILLAIPTTTIATLTLAYLIFGPVPADRFRSLSGENSGEKTEGA